MPVFCHAKRILSVHPELEVKSHEPHDCSKYYITHSDWKVRRNYSMNFNPPPPPPKTKTNKKTRRKNLEGGNTKNIYERVKKKSPQHSTIIQQQSFTFSNRLILDTSKKSVIDTDKTEHAQISMFIQQYQQKHTQTTILQMLSGCSFNQPYSSADQHIETKLTKFTGSTNLPQNSYKRYQGLLVLVSQKTLLSHSCSTLCAVSSRTICVHDDTG